MKQKINLLAILVVLTNVCLAQDYEKEFSQTLNAGDTAKQWDIPTQWDAANPTDAELFIAYFNYYYQKSRSEMIVLNGAKPSKGEDCFILNDSAGNYAGYLGSEISNEASNLKKAFDNIDAGIELHPNRLDMRFGKIYLLGKIEDWKTFTDEIVRTIDYSTVNKNDWTWAVDKKMKGSLDAFLGSLQDYQAQLFDTEEDSLLPYMQRIAETVLKYYPDHVESMSNIAVYYILTGKWEQALNYLLKAEKIASKDCVVLGNMAYVYSQIQNKDKAIAYYKKLIKYGNDQDKIFAKQKIEQMEAN